jgi:hypothetical protein
MNPQFQHESSHSCNFVLLPRTYNIDGMVHPLSFNQEQMLRLHALNSGIASYNCIYGGWHRNQHVSDTRDAWKFFMRRHEVLRSIYSTIGQRVTSEVFDRVPVLSVASTITDGLQALQHNSGVTLRLYHEHATRASIANVAGAISVLTICFHHICFDYVGMGILFKEVTTVSTND